MFTNQRVASLVAEFLGTAILALTVLAVATSQIGLGYFVSLGAGLALVLLVLSIGNISGAVVNPAVTIGLWTVRQITTLRAVAYIIVQLLGGLAAFGLFSYLTNSDTWTNRSAGYDSTILVAEVLGTAIFAFGIAAAVFQRMSGVTKALTIGGSLTLGIMVASIASSAFLNPAVALSAQTWELGSYVLGPVLGAIIGANLYSLLYLSANAPVERAGASAARPSKLGLHRVLRRRERSAATTRVVTEKTKVTTKPKTTAAARTKKTTKTTKKK